jgi:hypothetical protein
MTDALASELTSREPRPPRRRIDPAIPKKFREQVHALGGVWIFLGGLVVVGAMYLSTVSQPLVFFSLMGQPMPLAILAGLGCVWITLGVQACQKKMWALKAGLVLTYLGLINNVVSWVSDISTPGSNPPFPIVGLMMAIGIISQCHRVISWAGKMQKAGVPLTALPGAVTFTP